MAFDTESVISIKGLAVMADPTTHVTQEQLEEIQHLERIKQSKKDTREIRRNTAHQKKLERLETASMLSQSGSGVHTEVFRQQNENKKKNLQESKEDNVFFAEKSKESDSEVLSVLTSDVTDADHESSVEIQAAMPSKLKKDYKNMMHRRKHRRMKAKDDVDLGSLSSASSSTCSFGSSRSSNYSYRTTNTTKSSGRTQKSKKKNFFRNRRSSLESSVSSALSSAYGSGGEKDEVKISKSELDKFLQAEIAQRIREMEKRGIPRTSEFDIETADKWRLEKEQWRMKMTMEEQEVFNNSNMFINLGAQVLETFFKAVPFPFLKANGLAREVDKAVTAGKFDSCIRSYANSGGGVALMKDPVVNFITTSSAIIFKTHLSNKYSSSSQQEKEERAVNPGEDKKEYSSLSSVFIEEQKKKHDEQEKKIDSLQSSIKELANTMNKAFDRLGGEQMELMKTIHSISARTRVPVPLSAESQHNTKQDNVETKETESQDIQPQVPSARKPITSIRTGIDMSGMHRTLKKIGPSLKTVNDNFQTNAELQKKRKELDDDLGIVHGT